MYSLRFGITLGALILHSTALSPPIRWHTTEARSIQAALTPPPNLPLVIWHGLGDTYDSDGINSISELVNHTIGPTYTYNIRIDDDPSADRTATFLGDLNAQIATVCHTLATHPILSAAPAINALGFSQGGQFLRGYIERCNTPPVANLVTFGSQHNGISEFQACKSGDWVCQSWDGLLKANTWSSFVQTRLVPAQYFRDPEDLDAYLEHSNFLADINNEHAESRNATYRANMLRLERFAMFMFEEDTTVVPKESAYFYEVNSTSQQVTKLQDRDLYREDWLGLRSLDEQGKLDFKIAPGGHMQLDQEVLEDTFRTYFAGNSGKHGGGHDADYADL